MVLQDAVVFADRPRVTLYDAMDPLSADLPPRLVADRLRLSARLMQGTLDYLAAHREKVEREYQEVLADAEKQRRMWEERNRERLAQIAAMPPRDDHPELCARLADLRARIAGEASDDLDDSPEIAAHERAGIL